jgi:hypothetical protein
VVDLRLCFRVTLCVDPGNVAVEDKNDVRGSNACIISVTESKPGRVVGYMKMSAREPGGPW